jgi:hypothetical protein
MLDICTSNSVLTDAVFRIQMLDETIEVRSLPGVLSDLMADRVLDYPAIRHHHSHIIHMYFSQLMALVTEHSTPVTEDDFRDALLKLDARPETWQIFPKWGETGFMQPAFPDNIVCSKKFLKDNRCNSPSQIDFTWYSNRHIVKFENPGYSDIETWLWQLIALQTGAVGNGKGNYASFKINSGTSSRCYWSVYDRSWGVGRRVVEDARLINERLEETTSDFGFAKNEGATLMWTLPWAQSKDLVDSMVYPHEIDARCLEVCRRINLCRDSSGVIYALKAGSLNPRSSMARTKTNLFRRGVCGDIWTPVISEKDEEKALSLDSRGLVYSQLAKYACGIGSQDVTITPAPATNRGVDDPVLVVTGIAGGQGKTEGIFHREITFGRGQGDNPFSLPNAGEVAEVMILDAQIMLKALRYGTAAFLDLPVKKLPAAIDARFAKIATSQVDGIFFEHLEALFDDEDIARIKWVSALHKIGETVLEEVFDALQVSRIKKMRRIIEAQSAYHKIFWSTSEKPGFSAIKDAVLQSAEGYHHE